MKRIRTGLFLLLLCFLCACENQGQEGRIKVCLMETDGIAIPENGLLIVPGEDAVFHLAADEDRVITGVDYTGRYLLLEEDDHTYTLELKNVQYPIRVHVDVSDRIGPYVTIRYDQNGGEGTAQEVWDITKYPRPNTVIGTDVFFREGYTLTSWNTKPDGSGTRIGLGSRVTPTQAEMVLYAQWAPWTAAEAFSFADGTITAYRGSEREVVIPETIDREPVRAIAADAFYRCGADTVILPPTLLTVEEGAFQEAALTTLLLFDSIKDLSDAAFSGCDQLQTLLINAATPPYGHQYRRESVYADKVDLLITSLEKPRLVFYGGCSMWYNLIGGDAEESFPGYTVVNMGLNGVVSSRVQMEIMGAFLKEGDILFHTPEISSEEQLMTFSDMYNGDDKLWCGIEYNYDLFSLVDIRGMGGVFDSLANYLEKKKPGGSYLDSYTDADGNVYMDSTGSLPGVRTETARRLTDKVSLQPSYLEDGLPRLKDMYGRYQEKGVIIYVSYACVDVDALPADERGNVELMDKLYHETFGAMDKVAVISRLSDYLYANHDFYDTCYHLLTNPAHENTKKWMLDLKKQMEADGLFGE
ncbi:MAG: InlB B-repeat-containing protein [Lachnospiraceae bacterium]|nr:InlB B-repeat-containing protein [Lachnospiraceae bacterium]